MRATVVVLAVLAMAWCAQVQAQEKSKLPEAKAAVVKEAPKIDGVLDEAVWKEAVEIKEFKDPEGAAPKGKARVLVARDDKALYLAVESFEDADKLKKMVADVVDHDGEGLWEDDSVEFFIDPTNRRKAYYHLIINSKNVVWDSVHRADDADSGDTSWNPKLQSAAKTGEKSWVVEMAIPFDQFDRTANGNTEWAFNFLSNRNMTDGSKEILYFSPISGSAHTPEKFGTLTNMPTWKDRAVTKKLED